MSPSTFSAAAVNALAAASTAGVFVALSAACFLASRIFARLSKRVLFQPPTSIAILSVCAPSASVIRGRYRGSPARWNGRDCDHVPIETFTVYIPGATRGPCPPPPPHITRPGGTVKIEGSVNCVHVATLSPLCALTPAVAPPPPGPPGPPRPPPPPAPRPPAAPAAGWPAPPPPAR